MRTHRFLRGLKFIVLAAAAVALFGFVTMHLWNWLTPALFGWKLVSFWQATGLVVLSRILFGGFHRRFGGGMHWRNRMMDRWEQMTPEERGKFRGGMRHRCGHCEAPAEKTTA
jgi:H+/Cl- antiporter ClcA